MKYTIYTLLFICCLMACSPSSEKANTEQFQAIEIINSNTHKRDTLYEIKIEEVEQRGWKLLPRDKVIVFKVDQVPYEKAKEIIQNLELYGVTFPYHDVFKREAYLNAVGKKHKTNFEPSKGIRVVKINY